MIFTIGVILVALECFYIFYLETLATSSVKTSQTFNMSTTELKTKAINNLLKNQGVYNGVIGIGLLYGQFFATSSMEIIRMLLIYIIIVAIYGSLTVDKKIILKQGGLPIIALMISFI